MSLFVPGLYIGTSRTHLLGKIECDALTEEDWAWAAEIVAASGLTFGWVAGVPEGGHRFAKACRKHITESSSTILILDDVWTTGASMIRIREIIGVEDSPGFVLFARSPLPPWCQAIFQGHPALRPRQ